MPIIRASLAVLCQSLLSVLGQAQLAPKIETVTIVPDPQGAGVAGQVWTHDEQVPGFRAASLYRIEGETIGSAVHERTGCLRATHALLARIGTLLGWPAAGLTFAVDAWRDNELGGLVVLTQTLPVNGEPRSLIDTWVRVVYGGDGSLRGLSHRVWLGAAPVAPGHQRLDAASARRRVMGRFLPATESLRVDDATVVRRVVVVGDDGVAHAAHEVAVEGRRMAPPFLRDKRIVYVAERGGAIVGVRGCCAFNAVGGFLDGSR